MNAQLEYTNRALAFLIAGDAMERKAILGLVKPEYYGEECFSDIHKAAAALDEQGKDVDMLSLQLALTSDEDPDRLLKRFEHFRSYFEAKGRTGKCPPDEELKSNITYLLVELSSHLAYSISPEEVAMCIRIFYSAREKKGLLLSYTQQLDNNPGAEFTEDIAFKLKSLDDIVLDKSWTSYIVDPFATEDGPEDVALISRKGQPLFWRENIYLISGFSGVMKSYLCMVLAAAALNRGAFADRTLSFSSVDARLKVLYVDTELAQNTIKSRMKTLLRMTGNGLDSDLFKYIALNKVPGGIQTRLNMFNVACRQFEPDIIIVDSGRDFCNDFNDNKESDVIVGHFKQLAARYGAVLICTCHRTLGSGNAKGHFGTRFNEEAGIAISLSKKDGADGPYIEAEFTKQREGVFDPFKFRFNQELECLEEYDPTTDSQAVRKLHSNAESAVTSVLRPGESIRHNILVSRLMSKPNPSTGRSICQSTAKSYIRDLTGTVLVQTEDGQYRLSGEDREIPFVDDLPVA